MVWNEQHQISIDFEEINTSPNQSSFTQTGSSDFQEYASKDSASIEDLKPKLSKSVIFLIQVFHIFLKDSTG